jgi:hypothetical protein
LCTHERRERLRVPTKEVQYLEISRSFYVTCSVADSHPYGLYKGKGKKQDASNTRGIALLSILAKAYEKILVDRIIIFLEKNGQFDQNSKTPTDHGRPDQRLTTRYMLVMNDGS